MALTKLLTTLAVALPLALAQTETNETVLGVYIFHRHGDRTAKMTPPANLTDLGYQEVYTSGSYYRSRYIESNATYKINGMNTDLVLQSQLTVTAPADTVLTNSALGFLQGLYPPVGSGLDTQTLRNGTVITAPMQGYQLIPVSLSTGSGTSVESQGWLQAASGCAKATISSNNYFLSDQYTTLLNSTHDFYQNILPVINGTYNSTTDTFKNAYTIFDLVNVAEIHNATINSSDLITDDVFFQLRTLADTHEWGLAYNASDDLRAIAGMTLAGQIVQALNGTITGKGANKLNIQFGNYATMASFYGLADLPAASADFYGVSDYASSLVFELYTNTSTPVSKTSYPSTDEIYLRFLFHNGTASNISEPVNYPLFGSGSESLTWDDFVTGMDAFAVSTTEQWCTTCGNYTGTCEAYAPANSSSSSSSSGSTTSDSKSGNGLSPAVNGVIGALVALAVVLGIEAIIMALGGLRLVSKKRLAGTGSPATSVTGGSAAKA